MGSTDINICFICCRSCCCCSYWVLLLHIYMSPLLPLYLHCDSSVVVVVTVVVVAVVVVVCCSYRVLLLHVSALVESLVASISSLMIISPRGSLAVTSCPVSQLADWYTLFQNPSPDYVHIIYCTQEAVYPLWVEFGCRVSQLYSLYCWWLSVFLSDFMHTQPV